MNKIDFTNPDDIHKFACNYEQYREQVSLPIDIQQRIEKVQEVLDFEIISRGEAASRIIRIINGFMQSLE